MSANARESVDSHCRIHTLITMAFVTHMGNGVRGVIAAALLWPLACAVAEDPEPSRDAAPRGGAEPGGMVGSSGTSASSGGGAAGAWSAGAPAAGAGTAVAGAVLAGTGGGGRPISPAAGSAGKAAPAEGGTSSAAGALASSMGGSPAGRSSSGGSPAGASAGGAIAGAASAGKASGGGGAAGTASTAGAGSGGCANASGCLLHRYTFSGSGTLVEDSIGDADATAVNTTLQGGGVPLAGGTSDQYVRIPPWTLSGLKNATLEVWLTWSGGAAWQRIFDFGSNDGSAAGAQGAAGVSYLFLTPRAYNSTGKLRAAYSVNGPNMETRVEAAWALTTGTVSHVAVVVDDVANKLALYLNGNSAGSSALTGSLSAVDVQNFWLGRSQFQVDPELGGTIHEFRIYGAALTATEVRASFMAGSDALPSP